MNIEGVTLSLLLREEDKEAALSHFSELSQEYFGPAFKPVLTTIEQFYFDKGFMPSISELEVYRSRDRKMLSALSSIKLIDCKGIEISVAIEELENQYAQNFTLDLVDDLLGSISTMDKGEVVNYVSSMPLKLEDKIGSTASVYSISDIRIFRSKEISDAEKIYSGICDAWDYEAGGYYREELILLGGKRGSGKSIFCANLVAQQHRQNNVSMYFTIEMTYQETMERIISILSGVDYNNIKQNKLDTEETLKVARTVAGLFDGGVELLDEWVAKHAIFDILSFQDSLYKNCKEKDAGKIIIVDDRNMTSGTVDAKITAVKSRYGDKLALVVVDYLNQLVVDSTEDMYDWKPQIVIAKSLKNTARKNSICLVSPYQIDDNGIARFSKGILDAADVAQLIKVDDKTSGHITIETTKARSADDTGIYKIGIRWKTLTIDPRPVILEEMDKSDEDSKAGSAVEGLAIS